MNTKTEEIINEYSKGALGDVKVLMIEDDPFLSELVLNELSKHGCIPYSGLTGEKGLELAKQFQPDVVILDLMLPGLSGEEVITELKKDETLQGIPVIVFSNKSDESDISNLMSLGAAEYLVKSTTEIKEIASVIQKHLVTG